MVYVDPYGVEGTLKESQDQLYIQSEDPWNNKGTYITQFEGIQYQLKPIILGNKVHIVDLGCGGGNVLEGLVTLLSPFVDKLRVTGIDISPTAIKRLNNDPRFIDRRSMDFQVGDFSKIDLLPFLKDFVNIYTIVDAFCSVETTYKEVATHIWSLVPVNSWVIVADCDVAENRKFKKIYNKYSDAFTLINFTTLKNVVQPKTKNWTSKFNWSIYQKVDD